MSLADMSLSDARQLDQAYEISNPYDELGRIEALLPLGAFRQDAPSQPLRGDPSAALKPKGSGKKLKVDDYSDSVRKMLAKNKNRSQYGPNFRNDDTDNMVRMLYADHTDSV